MSENPDFAKVCLPHDLRAAARALGGEASGNRVLCPGPGHSPDDRSLSVVVDPNASEGFVVHSFAGDDPLVCRDHVRACLGLPSFKPAKPRRDRRSHLTLIQPCHETPPTNGLGRWEQARHPTGTLAETYLDSRGLLLPAEAAGAAIRFHPACPFKLRSGEIVRLPAMMALLRTITGDEPVAVHRTALRGDGRGKATMPDGSEPRRMLGPAKGAAVKFTPDENVTTCLGIGEGIETTLSLRRVPEFGSSPVWSLLSAGGVEQFPVVPGIESLWIAVDHDQRGIGAAQTCAKRWRSAGREVFLVKTTVCGFDLNDLVMGGSLA